MKIQIEVPNEHIDAALAEPNSRYWASEAVWKIVDGSHEGYLVRKHLADDHLGPPRIELDDRKLETALVLMASNHARNFGKLMTGCCDGETGDVLLQLMAFGEVKYG